MQKILFLFPLFFSISLFAQNGPIDPLSARSNGVGNASVAFTGMSSLFNNQAGLADLKKNSFLFSGQQTFSRPYSNNFGGGLAFPTSSGTFGMLIYYFGMGDIRQHKFGFAFARKLGETLSAGIQFNYLNTELPMQDKSNLFTFEIGLQYEVIDNLLLGIHLYNPPKLEIAEDELLPRVLRTGATYSPTKRLLIHAELEKEVGLPLILKGGVEYELVKNLWVRTGFQDKPLNINVGVGYLFKKGFRFNLAAYYKSGFDYYPNALGLGLIPSFDVGYDFGS